MQCQWGPGTPTAVGTVFDILYSLSWFFAGKVFFFCQAWVGKRMPYEFDKAVDCDGSRRRNRRSPSSGLVQAKAVSNWGRARW